MNRTGPLLAAFLLLTAVHPVLAGPGDRESLSSALKKGRIEFEAIAMHGFEKIEITVRNLTDKPLRLDPVGSVLTPPDPVLQRLGLAGVIGGVPGEDSSLILLSPQGKWTGLIHAVCMDFGKGTPPNGVPYKLSASQADDKAYKVLRYWAEHPHIRQSTVNDVIWTGQTLKTLKTQVLPDWLLNSQLVANGGRIYWLTGRRSLFALSEDGSTWTRIGENLDFVAAGGGQLAGTIANIPGLRWYNMTERRWEYFFLSKPPDRVLLGPDRSIFVLARGQLLRYQPGSKDFSPITSLPASQVALSPTAVSPTLYMVTSENQILHRYDPDKGAWIAVKGGKVAGKVDVSERSVYAVMTKGVYRFSGRWKAIRTGVWDFVAGRRRCFLFQKKRFAVYDEERNAVVMEGVLPRGGLARCVDRVLDRLYVLDEQGRLHTVGANGEWTVLCQVPDIEKRAK